MLSRSDLEKRHWSWDEEQVREEVQGEQWTVAEVVALGDTDAEPAGALLAASPRLALACQSAVALAGLIERAIGPSKNTEPASRFVRAEDVLEAARALGLEARQALAAAGVAAEGGR